MFKCILQVCKLEQLAWMDQMRTQFHIVCCYAYTQSVSSYCKVFFPIKAVYVIVHLLSCS